jgi:hypothetical protein
VKFCTGMVCSESAFHPHTLSNFFRCLRAAAVVIAVLFALLVDVNHASAETGQMQLSSRQFLFGKVYLTLSVSKTLTITNTGKAALVISRATVSGAGFSMGDMNLPKTLDPGKSISVAISFIPSVAGWVQGSLSIFNNVSSSATNVLLRGIGMSQTLSLIPKSVAFSSVPVGSAATQNGTLKNTGRSSLVISKVATSDADFKVTGLATPLTITSGKSVTFTVHFKPQSTAGVSGAATFATTTEGSVKLTLRGTGVAAAGVLRATPANLAFGSVDVGSSTRKTVSIQNAGTSSVSVSAVKLSGSGFAATGIETGELLAAGKSVSLTVIFAPTASSSSSGNIVVSSSASNSSLTISLSGSGVQSAQPSVTLSWSPSKSSVAGYNVYRSTVSGGPYTTILNSGLITALTFIDTTVQAGRTYYYVIRAVAPDGAESTDSNQAAAALP